MAELPEETQALDERYDLALQDAQQRGAEDRVREFEQAVDGSRAVITYSFDECYKLSESNSQLAQTFYARGTTNLTQGSHVLQGPKWDAIRATAETALFGDENKKEIHFAALSLSDEGLQNYGGKQGKCYVSLKGPLVRHRTSAFHENMLVFFKGRGGDYWKDEQVPRGFRGNWSNRGRLAVAKLAGRIDNNSVAAGFHDILMQQGATSADDEFIELHVFGSLTVQTFDHVTIERNGRRPAKAKLKSLKHRLSKWNVSCREL